MPGKGLNFKEKFVAALAAATYATLNWGFYTVGGVNGFDLLDNALKNTLNQSIAQKIAFSFNSNSQIEEFILLCAFVACLTTANFTNFYDLITLFLSKQDKASWERIKQMDLNLMKLNLDDKTQKMQYQLIDYFIGQCTKKTKQDIYFSFEANSLPANNNNSSSKEEIQEEKDGIPFHLMIVSEDQLFNVLVKKNWKEANIDFNNDTKELVQKKLDTFIKTCSQDTMRKLYPVIFMDPQPMILISDREYVKGIAHELLEKSGVLTKLPEKIFQAYKGSKRVIEPIGAEYKNFCAASSIALIANIPIKNMEITYFATVPVFLVLGLLSQYSLLAKDHDKKLVANNAISFFSSVLIGGLVKMALAFKADVNNSTFSSVLAFSLAYLIDKGLAAKFDTVMVRWPIEKIYQFYMSFKQNLEKEPHEKLGLSKQMVPDLTKVLEQTIWKAKKIGDNEILVQEHGKVYTAINITNETETASLLPRLKGEDQKTSDTDYGSRDGSLYSLGSRKNI